MSALDAIDALVAAIIEFRNEWLDDSLRDVLDETLENYGITLTYSE